MPTGSTACFAATGVSYGALHVGNLLAGDFVVFSRAHGHHLDCSDHGEEVGDFGVLGSAGSRRGA